MVRITTYERLISMGYGKLGDKEINGLPERLSYKGEKRDGKTITMVATYIHGRGDFAHYELERNPHCERPNLEELEDHENPQKEMFRRLFSEEDSFFTTNL